MRQRRSYQYRGLHWTRRDPNEVFFRNIMKASLKALHKIVWRAKQKLSQVTVSDVSICSALLCAALFCIACVTFAICLVLHCIALRYVAFCCLAAPCFALRFYAFGFSTFRIFHFDILTCFWHPVFDDGYYLYVARSMCVDVLIFVGIRYLTIENAKAICWQLRMPRQCFDNWECQIMLWHLRTPMCLSIWVFWPGGQGSEGCIES